jgi:uncharacterized protein (TIGR04255 family)
MAQTAVLNIPDFTPQEYKRNLIKTAVCELRYPVLLELEETAPVKFQTAIRRDYPRYERRTNFKFHIGMEHTREPEYHFTSVNKKWTVRVTTSAVSLETDNYSGFTEFMKRIKGIVAAANQFIDSPLFTRVGLRYVDAIPVPRQEFDQWVNEELVRPLMGGRYGQPEMCWQIIQGACESGNFTFQHGIRKETPGDYILDFDFFKEDVEIKSVETVLRALHKESLKLFFWAIVNKSLEHMEPV